MKILKLVLFITASNLFTFSQAQEKQRLDEKIDEITYKWDLEADKLTSYESLIHLCQDSEYRNNIFDLLHEINHYDTVLYDVISKLSRTSDDREIKKTLKEIKKLEAYFSPVDFVQFMKQECHEAGEIEKNVDKTKNQVGYESYSSKAYMLEVELYKYVKNITKRVDRIRKHVHHLSGHYEN